MPPRLKPGLPWTRAFTLIELLVSMTVTLLLVVALMRIFSATATTWQRGEAQVDAYREARGALQIMARDLSATLQAGYAPSTIAGTKGTAASPTPTPAVPQVPTLALQRVNPIDSGPQNEEVYCLTNILNHSNASFPASGYSTLCAVGYFCRWLPDPDVTPASSKAPPPHAFALMRQFLNSDDTFRRLAAATPGQPLSFVNVFGQAGSPAASVTQLAAYVWDLRFRIDTDLDEGSYPDGNADGVPKDHQGLSYSGSGGPSYPAYLPPYIEIRFKALSTNAARRLEGNGSINQGDWMDRGSGTSKPNLTSAYKSIIQPNAQQFVLRVPLINATPLPTP